MTLAYTEDGKLFPGNRKILSGKKEIFSYWTRNKDSRTIRHKIIPVEIKIIGKEARDYGYYEGTSINKEGEEHHFKGKYVVVWKKVGKDWKIYLDIWNRVPQDTE